MAESQNPIASFLSNPPWKPHLDSLISTIRTQTTRFFPQTPTPFARISNVGGTHRFDLAMPVEEVESRLAGVPVYALSNAAEEFVLVSGVRNGNCLGLFCFNKDDAESLLEGMRVANQDMREGSRVVAVALNKVFQLKVDGVAFRLIPDPKQVANAIREKERIGDMIEDFPGVPLFQSRSLVLKSDNKRYRPMFFRKEDLEESLYHASRQQNQLNPAFRKGDIQVCVLEEIINAMKGNSASKWDDVVFMPPGFSTPMGLTGEDRATAMG